MDYLYLFSSIFFGVYSQIIIRWQISHAGPLPLNLIGKIYFLLGLLSNLWIISALLATFLGGLSWMLTLARFELSYAYPWISLSYVFIFILGIFIFNESFSLNKIIGMIFLIIGIIFISRS